MPNKLAAATSPYLRQHADNPVDWYEWGPEALDRAKAEDKPILLSVGYSACHWCHVMAHESFEDPAIAASMNAHYINIKVDREERPDIDAVYQKVVALMGQGGGWPLTVFLTPDQRPFYGGTYFPPEDRYGRPGFPRLLDALAQLWKDRRDEALSQAETFMGGFADIAAGIDEDAAAGVDLRLASADSLAEASRRLLTQFDPEWGGFGRAPKFPNVPSLELLLRAGESEPALTKTLEAMWRGGIYDHLRGGFARYSVDREWLIPHFEKMLYDNALLLGLYADASVTLAGRVTAPFLRRVVEETAAYLIADMRDDQGLFYSATDADSEGVEGKYFCWTVAELEQALGEPLGRTFARAYGVTDPGNFEEAGPGASVLHRPLELPPALDHELESARAKLLEVRYGRVPPARDDKRLTAWNALTITGLCKAATAAESWATAAESWATAAESRATAAESWATAAESSATAAESSATAAESSATPELASRWTAIAVTAADALLRIHRDADGRLLRASWDGRGHTRAYLEDVALLAEACLDLHERTLDPRWHAEAEALAHEILDHYARPGGGFYDTADDGEALIERTESQHDSPLPSGVAAAVEVLARLELGGPAGSGVPEQARAQIEQTLSRFHKAAARPQAHAGLIVAAQWVGDRATHVTVRGPTPEHAQALAAAVRKLRPQLPGPIAIGFSPGPAIPDALVCRAQACSMPITDLAALVAELSTAAPT